jgi:Mn-dependent DtxR family transcriptional regulator
MNTEKSQINKLSQIYVSSSELAELFGGITTTHVQKLERDGIVKKVERGIYDLKESVRSYIRYLKREGKHIAPDTYEAHRARLYKGRADITEVQAAALKGQFHDAQCIAEVMSEKIASARARLLALPTVAGPQVADLSEANECVDVLTELVHDALSDLTKYDARAVVARYVKQHIEAKQDELDNENDNIQ